MDREWTPVVVAVVFGSCATALILLKWTRNHRVQQKIQSARNRRETSFKTAQQAVQQFKEKNPGLDMSPILDLPLSELIDQIRAGILQPETVLHAYMEKALQVNSKLNCSTGVLMESAKHLEEIESYKDGLLYGVPISIKENIGFKDSDSTCGVLCKLDDPAVKDSVVVTVLKSQGAIPFIKTNVPQGLLSYECSNPIYGKTVNPCNLQKTSGGSSGGEAALISGGGSILGLGTDIGGSIRIPASFCGICGLKPTSNRISLRGLNSCLKGVKTVLSAIGPMARDVESLALCMRALLCEKMFMLDPTVPPLPFNQKVYECSDRLRIGYFENDGYLQPSPSMARALRETKKLLEEAGHTLVPFKPPANIKVMHEYIVRSTFADGAATLLSNLNDGPIDPCLQAQITPYRFPGFLKKILSVILKPIYPRIAGAMDALCGIKSIADLWKQHTNTENYIHEVINQWNELEMDVLLCPMLGPAYNFSYCGKLTSALSYTIIYNLLNFPVGVVPVTTVTAEDEAQLKDYKGNFGDIWDKLFVKAIQGSVGLPVAVQCVALPWQEELCLRFMREVERVCANNKLSNNTH
ncbi:fatty-acid amide hydrolase 1 [Hoplias malabaricus]|uniref:fatty-acid amide hydrolase 1 n=1 Tax=Hoplias malabaricus TaxID=27720 RepID=UPI0034620E60